MSDTTLSARLRPAVGALGRGADALATNVRLVLAAIIVGQVLLTVALFLGIAPTAARATSTFPA